MELKLEGFVVKTVDYKDYDLLVNVLTKEKLILLRARGVRKPGSKNSSICRLYSYSEFEVHSSQRGYLTLKSGRLLNYYSDIFSSLKNTLFVSMISNYVYSSFKENISFALMKKSLEKLKISIDLRILFVSFLSEVIQKEGVSFSLDGCVYCGNKKQIVDFCFDSGGFICKDCGPKEKKPSLYLKTLRHILKTKIEDCDKMKVDDFENLAIIAENLVSILEERVGLSFPGWKMFKHIVYKGGNVGDFK